MTEKGREGRKLSGGQQHLEGGDQTVQNEWRGKAE